MTITIGVPVFNGGTMLRECLTCLRDQTFRDFIVLVYDNASTDDTAAIAREFAASDARFTYFRQPENRGPAQNFIDVMEAARTPFFMWRAHDDLSDLNFLEACHAALEASPHAVLAATRVERERIAADGSRTTRTIPFALEQEGDWLVRLPANLSHLHQSWFYGLWRHEPLKLVFHRIYGAYPYAWASDFLMLYSVLIRDGIVGTDGTAFHTRIVRKSSQHASQAEPRNFRDLALRRSRFRDICLAEASDRTFSRIERLRLLWAVDRFTSRRVGSRSKVVKLFARSYRP